MRPGASALAEEVVDVFRQGRRAPFVCGSFDVRLVAFEIRRTLFGKCLHGFAEIIRAEVGDHRPQAVQE